MHNTDSAPPDSIAGPFRAVFAPLGRAGSLDAYLQPAAPAVGDKAWDKVPEQRSSPTAVASFGVLLLHLQTVLLYIQSAWMKAGPEWRAAHDLSAVALTLHIDVWVRPLGLLLRSYPSASGRCRRRRRRR